jgi:hypothetical protein
VVAGDFTGNGIQDLAVLTADVKVLLGNGDGTFQPARTVLTGAFFYSLAVGSFTHSGHLDFVVTDPNHNAVEVLLGNGDGTFQPPQSYFAGTAPQAIAVGDFNGDGNSDVVVTNPGTNQVNVLFGNGDGSFQAPITLEVGLQPRSVAVGDFNSDGFDDFVVANYQGGDVTVVLSDGQGFFQAPDFYHVGTEPRSLAVGDFTGNGILDLAVADEGPQSTFEVLLGNGDGTFQDPLVSQFGLEAPFSMAVGDFTGRGTQDIAVASGQVTILAGQGDGTFQPLVDLPAGGRSYSVAAADFNGDGRLDIASANYGGENVGVLLASSDGSFRVHDFPAGGSPYALAAGDFTGNGIQDLAVADDSSNTVNILLGNGDGTFQAPVSYPVGNFPLSVVVGDFTGNGILDLAVANAHSNSVSVLLGNGDGTFGPARDYPVGVYPYSLVVGHFTGDGHLDLAVSDDNYNSVSVLLGNGDGTFQDPRNTVALDGALAVGDLEHDGYDDLVATYPGRNGSVSVLLSTGDGYFQPPLTFQIGSQSPYSIAVADLTGNGNLDLVVANEADSRAYTLTVSVLLGNGDGTFGPAVTYVVGMSTYVSPQSVVVADFTGDGIPDIAVNLGSWSVKVLTGNGDGTFQVPYSGYLGGLGIVTADLNGDSLPDLVGIDGSNVSVLLNDGNWGGGHGPGAAPHGGRRPEPLGGSPVSAAPVEPWVWDAFGRDRHDAVPLASPETGPAEPARLAAVPGGWTPALGGPAARRLHDQLFTWLAEGWSADLFSDAAGA